MEVWEEAFEEDSNDSTISEIFSILEETGALVVTGLNRNGEPVYKVTEKCREIFPELLNFHLAQLNEIANELWQLGVVDIVFNQDTFSVGFTRENYNKYRQIKDYLTNEQMDFLDVLVGFNLQLALDLEANSPDSQ